MDPSHLLSEEMEEVAGYSAHIQTHRSAAEKKLLCHHFTWVELTVCLSSHNLVQRGATSLSQGTSDTLQLRVWRFLSFQNPKHKSKSVRNGLNGLFVCSNIIMPD